LVFVNGLGAQMQTWYAQVQGFRRSWRTVCYNQRGISGSELADEDATMRDFARDLVGLLNHLGIYRASFVGISFGSRVLQELALGWPARISALVLVGASPGGRRHVRGDPAAGALLRRAHDLSVDEWFEGLMPHLFGRDYLQRNRPRLRRLATWWAQHPQDPRALARHWQAWEHFDRWEDLPRLRAPTLLLHGSCDSLSPPANGRSLAARIPGARLELMEGLGHSPNVEDPARFNALLRDFLQQVR